MYIIPTCSDCYCHPCNEGNTVAQQHYSSCRSSASSRRRCCVITTAIIIPRITTLMSGNRRRGGLDAPGVRHISGALPLPNIGWSRSTSVCGTEESPSPEQTSPPLGKWTAKLRDSGSGQGREWISGWALPMEHRATGLTAFDFCSATIHASTFFLVTRPSPGQTAPVRSGRSAIDDIPNSLSRRLEPKTSDFRDAQSFPLQTTET